MTRSCASVLAILALLLLPGPAHGQGPPRGGPLPAEVEREVLEFLNDPGTLRAAGGTRIPEGTRLVGSLGVLGGDLHVAGVVDGPVVVANGDLVLLPGGRIEGAVLVVGGRVEFDDPARIGGPMRHYQAPLRFRIRADRVEAAPTGVRELPPLLQADLGFASIRPRIRSAGNYNRSEGLPVLFGPELQSGGRNPTRVEALALWRSTSGLELDTEALGYQLTVEQELGGSGEGMLGFSLHSATRAIEDRGISNAEASFTTFFLRRDFRDYFEAEGWSAYLELNPLNRPIRARFEYREETHVRAPIRNPWTLRDQDEPWRPMPLVAEGPTRQIALGLVLDTRDEPADPSTGWWIDSELRRRVGGGLALPEFTASDESVPLSTDLLVDLRRYNRLGPNTRLNLRLLLAGSIDGNPLAPQFQRTLGGEGSLPGHPRFAIDCGARSMTVTDGDETAFPFYGCDRVGLAQVELRGGLPFSWRPDLGDRSHPELASLLELRPAWTLFAGVGRGRSLAPDPMVDGRVDSPVRADVGAGLYVGPLGLYWAYPLNRRERGLNFMIRLDRRF